MTRPPRSCLNCGRLCHAPRCPSCTITSNPRRGYGRAHQAARTQLIAQLPTPCGYGCGRTLYTPTELVAAHRNDGNPNTGWLPSCRSCNERAKKAKR